MTSAGALPVGTSRKICEGRHLKCCATCRYWVPNLQTPPTEMDEVMRAQLFDGKCADWKARQAPAEGREL